MYGDGLAPKLRNRNSVPSVAVGGLLSTHSTGDSEMYSELFDVLIFGLYSVHVLPTCRRMCELVLYDFERLRHCQTR